MMALQSQSLLWPPLACNTARTHQQPKNATSGYFTWETGTWQQEKQHQMSQVSDEYRHRVRNRLRKIGLRAWRPYFGAVLRRRHRLPRVRWCTEYGTGICKTGGECGSAMNQDSCCRKEMAVHVSTDAGMRGSQGTASFRSTISSEEVWWCGVPYPTPEKLNWCASPATLAPLDTEMKF